MRASCWAGGVWTELTREYNVYDSMQNNPAILSETARQQGVSTPPDQVKMIWQRAEGTGAADRSTDLLKTLKNASRDRTFKGEAAEYFDEWCCSPCTVMRNLREVKYLIKEEDRTRKAAMQKMQSLQPQNFQPQNFQPPSYQQPPASGNYGYQPLQNYQLPPNYQPLQNYAPPLNSQPMQNFQAQNYQRAQFAKWQ
jgi:hypothetical protein